MKENHRDHGIDRQSPDRFRAPQPLLHGTTTSNVIGAFYRVYRELGVGFVESVYSRSMVFELRSIGSSVVSEWPIRVSYRGNEVGYFKCDLVVDQCVLVELKAAEGITSAHSQQVLNYLAATELEVGLLLNFGMKPEFRRLLMTNDRKYSVLNSPAR